MGTRQGRAETGKHRGQGTRVQLSWEDGDKSTVELGGRGQEHS